MRLTFGTPLARCRDLKASSLPRLIDVLECFPRGYSAASIGQLPDLSVEGEQAVCLFVRLQDIKVRKGPNFASLTAIMKVVDPNDVDVPGDISGWNDDSGRQRCVHILRNIFRRGAYAQYAVNQESLKLQHLGDVFAVAGQVEPASIPSPGSTDAWTLKEGSVEFVPTTELQSLAGSGDDHVRVSYSRRGSLAPQALSALVGKAQRMLVEAAGRGLWSDPIPEEIRGRYGGRNGLCSYIQAIEGMHAPSSAEHYEECRRSLAFQELFYLQLKLLLQRAAMQMAGAEAPAVQVGDWSLADLALQALPFGLTGAQKRALETMRGGMAGWPPMACLLQGDVGCGKTVVAMLAALGAAGSGYQSAIMAPTEILAEQHYKSVTALLERMKELEGGERVPQVALLTGSTMRAERTKVLAGLADGSIGIVVGTHALLSGPVVFSRLGFAVVDEQHKFGVEQRAKLLAKACPPPHILNMSATPIPRSLALVAHGELDLVIIDELPPGRTPVATTVLKDSEDGRAELYTRVRQEIAGGGQVFIVCPLVESSSSGDNDDSPGSTMAGLKAAVQERDRLVAEGELEEGQCAVLHGRMCPEEKEAALAAFASGEVPVLISTTVVEVGVDVPAATMMVVEHADRFGLAQLHQLRGRVGRGQRRSSCVLVSDRSGQELERLRVLERTNDGFAVAKADFELRGAGELLGRRQSGRQGLGEMKACRLPGDEDLVEQAREAAVAHLARTGGDPRRWSKELVAAVTDESLIDLDLMELPSMK